MKTAVVVGASGLVGKACVYALLESVEYSRITILVRKQLALTHHKLHQVLVDFNNLEIHRKFLATDAFFCCLGTTIKEAGSQEAFKRVDVEYPVALARLAKAQGCNQFLLVSALGANAQSPIFYNRCKGEVEEAIQKIGFKSYLVFRPSLLLGARKQFRLGEFIAQKIAKTLSLIFSIGPLQKYKAIPASIVAKAMVAVSLNEKEGIHIYENDRLFRV
jgi:uncharacterized protein YbjT (DUF2867 family)